MPLRHKNDIHIIITPHHDNSPKHFSHNASKSTFFKKTGGPNIPVSPDKLNYLSIKNNYFLHSWVYTRFGFF